MSKPAVSIYVPVFKGTHALFLFSFSFFFKIKSRSETAVLQTSYVEFLKKFTDIFLQQLQRFTLPLVIYELSSLYATLISSALFFLLFFQYQFQHQPFWFLQSGISCSFICLPLMTKTLNTFHMLISLLYIFFCEVAFSL